MAEVGCVGGRCELGSHKPAGLDDVFVWYLKFFESVGGLLVEYKIWRIVGDFQRVNASRVGDDVDKRNV